MCEFMSHVFWCVEEEAPSCYEHFVKDAENVPESIASGPGGADFRIRDCHFYRKLYYS